MKTGKVYRQCLIFLQCLVSAVGINCAKDKVVVHEAYTEYAWAQPKLVFLFDVKKQKSRGRGPASMVPSDDLEAVPAADDIWLSNVFVEDSAGVMNNIKVQLQQWEQMEEYRQNWDIGSTGLYQTPDMERKRAWFNRMILRYADRRFRGSLKNAAQGSTLSRVSNVQNALRPSSTAEISKNFKLKFKFRLIQMRAFVRMINPWVEANTEIRADGRVNSFFSKNFEDLNLRAEFNYQVNEGHWRAQVSRPITENIRAVISSSKTEQSDNTMQFIYATAF